MSWHGWQSRADLEHIQSGQFPVQSISRCIATEATCAKCASGDAQTGGKRGVGVRRPKLFAMRSMRSLVQ